MRCVDCCTLRSAMRRGVRPLARLVQHTGEMLGILPPLCGAITSASAEPGHGRRGPSGTGSSGHMHASASSSQPDCAFVWKGRGSSSHVSSARWPAASRANFGGGPLGPQLRRRFRRGSLACRQPNPGPTFARFRGASSGDPIADITHGAAREGISHQTASN